MTRTIFLAALCWLSALSPLLAQCPTSGNTVQVINNSGTNVQGSLTWALTCLNSQPNLTTVTFNIPGSTIIQPNTLPNIGKAGALIDGNSQAGIVVDGASPAGAPTNCFVITAPNVSIRGLTIRNFTNASGGNAILANGNNPTIQDNTIVSNRTGITTGSSVFAFNISDNVIGTSGTGNTTNGIAIQGSPTAGVVAANEIAHNGASGITIIGGTVRITQNSIYCNPTSGITRPVPPALPVITQANTSQIQGTAPPNAVVEVFVHSTAGCAGAPCQGKTFVGSATALASGSWSLPTPGSVPPGSQVTATGTIGGTNTSAFATCQTVTDCSTFIAGINPTNVSCPGGNNGSAMATPSGSTLTYLWNTTATTQTISNLAAGTYTVTVTNQANGCTDSATAAVSQPSPLSVSFTNTNVSCFGGNNGSSTATGSGGTPGYTFVWSTGATGPTANNLPAGSFVVTMTDANNCPIVQTTSISQPATPVTSSISKTNVSCFGGSNGSATASGSGGTPGYTFAWSTGANGPTVTNLAAGTYTVTASDANGCTATQTTSITQPPVLAANVSTTNATCFGGSNGTATATGSGGTTPYSISWSNGVNGPLNTGLSAGTYTATVTDGNACTATQTGTVGQPPALQINVIVTDVSCFGGNDGSAAATGSGGAPGYTFAWSTGTNGPTANNLSAGIYTVTMTDGNTCTGTETASVLQPPAMGIGISKTNTSCFGGSNGSATATGSGGTPGYTFVWSNGANGPTANNLSAGTYTVTMSDAVGCTGTQTTTITQPPPLAASANATGVTCSGGTDGTASASGSGGTTPYTVSWSNGANGPLITGLSAGTYTATVTDGNGCTAGASATVGSPPPLAVMLSATDETANNANDGTATAVPSGGTPGYNFAWSNGSNTAMIANLPPGAYTVTVRDSRGCSRVATVVVNAFACAGLTVGVTGTNASCNGMANGSVTANPGGGAAPFTYSWNTGATTKTVNNLASGTYTVTVTDANNCTTIGATTIGQPPALVVSTSATAATSGQNNGTATASPSGGTPGYQYTWSNGGSTAQITGLAPGTYTVFVRDANSCSSTATAVVGSSGTSGPCTSLPAYALYAPTEVCGNDPFNLTVDDLFPAPVVQYRWIMPTGDTLVSTAQSISLVATSTAFSGQYFVVRDSAGCRSIPVGGAPLTVLSLPPGAAFAGNDTVSCSAGVAVLRAKPLTQGTGKWVSPSGARVDDANANPTSARDLKPGANIFVWEVSLGACAQAAADTVVYFWETPPSASDDTYTIQRAQDVAVMEVLLNDVLGGLEDTVVTQVGTPASGTLEYLPNTRRFRYTAEEGFRGTVQFRYVVCNPNSVCGFGCDTALVTIRVLGLPSVPEALVTNDPGPNGQLTIRNTNGFSRVEISIFDRWGDPVFDEKEYRNDNPWRGDYNRSGKFLPGGAYYYFLNAYEDGQQVGDTQTGVIHLFDGER